MAFPWHKGFTYRWFYDRKCSFICIFGIPDALVSLFDQVVSLPNSTDQDYDRESWEGILEKYAEKSPWYARTNSYETIWNRFKEILGNDATAAHISLYGDYDRTTLEQLLKEELGSL